MKRIIAAVLAAGFGLAALPLGVEPGDACENCEEHPKMGGARGEAHLHPDDGSAEEDSAIPCTDNHFVHCCCGRIQTPFAADALEMPAVVVVGLVTIPEDRARPDPVSRPTFHVPIA